MDIIRRTLLEKLARDLGFDRVAREHGDSLVVGSSHFGEEVLVKPGSRPDETVVVLAERSRPFDPAGVPGISVIATSEMAGAGEEERRTYRAENEQALAQLLSMVAEAAGQRRDQPLDRFRRQTAKLPKATEAERLVVARVGQDIFRDALIEYWGGRCAVTGLSVVSLLRASHAKPWKDCETDDERLDLFNGFLLAPQLDAAFDGGWISFDDDGLIVITGHLDVESAGTLGIRPDLRLRRLEDRHRPYLHFHRTRVFRT